MGKIESASGTPLSKTDLDLLVEGGEVVTETGRRGLDIGIVGGRVVTLSEPGTLRQARDRIDASGLHVLPGLVDAHVHVNLKMGEYTTLDGFREASAAAAHGGTTTMVDFAVPYGDETPEEAINRRVDEATANSYIDFSFHPTVARKVDSRVLEQVPRLVERGFPAFKAFTVYRDTVMVSLGDLRELMFALATHQALVFVHAETAAIIEHEVSAHIARGQTTPEFHFRSRPTVAEIDTVQSVVGLVRETGCPVCFVHLSCAGSVAVVSAARREGLPVFGETCPQYLVLDPAGYEGEHGELLVCSPPVRGGEHSEALWRSLEAGVLHTVNTDHCCYSGAQKREHRDFFPDLPNGLPGIETRLRLMLHFGYHERKMPLEQIVTLTSANPARLTGLYPRKGTIEVGADADLVLVDLDREGVIRAEHLHMATDYTPYEGLRYRGDVIKTICRGQVVVEGGNLTGGSGHGALIPGHLGANEWRGWR